MEEVIRSRFDGGLLGTNNTAYKRLLKRFSSANEQQMDCQTLLKELSAFETTLSLSELARNRFSQSNAQPPHHLSEELESVKMDLQLREEELTLRSSKRRKVEKVSQNVHGHLRYQTGIRTGFWTAGFVVFPACR